MLAGPRPGPCETGVKGRCVQASPRRGRALFRGEVDEYRCAPCQTPVCEQVRGHLDELPLVPCASPVGLCTIAQMNGSIHGDAIFTAVTITSSTDFPLTG